MGEEKAWTHVLERGNEVVRVLAVKGELTSSADVPLSKAYADVTARGAQRLVLDFEQATTINSAGVALVMRIATDCHRRQQLLAFSGLSTHFETLFHMAGLAQYGAIYANEADAIAALSSI